MLNHEECTGNSGVLQDTSHFCRPLPKRLVHVTGDPKQPMVRLYETPTGKTGQYVALSYCWGKDVPLAAMTTTETIDSKKRGIDIKSLPKTYTDAIAATLKLKQHYLWIDSLCIIQRSADWESEASKMGQYYGNALVTLCADAGWSSQNGFLTRDSSPFDPLVLSQPLPSVDPPKQCHLLVCRSIHSYDFYALDRSVAGLWYTNVEQCPLATRAWAMQERILAPRKLHFGADHLFWECRRSVLAEGGPAYFGRSLSSIADSAFQELTLKQSTGQITVKDWDYLVQRYSVRGLTQASDRLVAISGLAKVFSEVLRQPYLAGLWAHDLHGGLAWWVDSDVPVYRPETNTAPTWSWASIEGRVVANGGSGYVDEPAFTVVSATAPHMGADPFGPVAGGTLVLRGQLQRVRFEAKSPRTMFGVRSGLGSGERTLIDVGHSDDSKSGFDPGESDLEGDRRAVDASNLDHRKPGRITPSSDAGPAELTLSQPLWPQELTPSELLNAPDMSAYLSNLHGLSFEDKTHILGHSSAIGDYYDDLQLNRGGQVLWALRLSIAPVVMGPSIPSPQGILDLERVDGQEEALRTGGEGVSEDTRGVGGDDAKEGRVGGGGESGEVRYTYRRVGAGTTWDDTWYDGVEESLLKII